MKGFSLGIDIGGTNTKFGLVTPEGDVIAPQSFRTEAQKSFEDFGERLVPQITNYLRSNDQKLETIPIGIGVPNYSSVQNKLIAPPNLSWGTQDIGAKLNTWFKKKVFLENDANIAALGERQWGKAQNLDHFVLVTVGTGIGTGIFAHGQLIRGSTGQGAEGGHIRVASEGRLCGCGGLDHFESYCSVPAIKKQILKTYGKTLRYHDIVDLFHDGDSNILKIFRDVSQFFAAGLSQLILCFSPSKIILAGGGMTVGQDYVSMIENSLREMIFTPLVGSYSLEISDLSTKNGAILGAAAYALAQGS